MKVMMLVLAGTIVLSPAAAMAQNVGAGVNIGGVGAGASVGTSGVGVGAHVGTVGGAAGVGVRPAHYRRVCRGGWHWHHHHRVCRYY
ncbi:MAG: hypothetical protein ACJ8EL_22185 [Rhizomicrobium sp.]